MGRGLKWVQAIIVEVSGPLSYKVITNDGVRMKQHVSSQEGSIETPAATGNYVAIVPNAVEGEDQSMRDTRGDMRGRQELRPPSPVEEAEFRGFAPSVPTISGQTKDFVM
ncbi:hypothetical protein PR048_011024 [Dryococelus australis]|uniref:Uncharacterized protein n=1 Tax=Dryococelus australis TaxID=614101 RepID=A0ABQ9HLP5_9NEOP|nr:hypothetical protein PR048_011024 [Dryococelus australis]